jgi:hypothetical protein
MTDYLVPYYLLESTSPSIKYVLVTFEKKRTAKWVKDLPHARFEVTGVDG